MKEGHLTTKKRGAKERKEEGKNAGNLFLLLNEAHFIA